MAFKLKKTNKSTKNAEKKERVAERQRIRLLEKEKQQQRIRENIQNKSYYKARGVWGNIFYVILAFILSGLIVFGFVWTSTHLNNIKTGLDYSSHYNAIENVYNTGTKDFDPNNPGTPNGDPSIGATLQNEKLNPLNNLNIYTYKFSNHQVYINAPTSLYNNVQDFLNQINSSGQFTLLGQTSNVWKNMLTAPGTDAKANTMTQTKTSALFDGKGDAPHLGYTQSGSDIQMQVPTDSKQYTTLSKSITKMAVVLDPGEFLNEFRNNLNTTNPAKFATNANTMKTINTGLSSGSGDLSKAYTNYSKFWGDINQVKKTFQWDKLNGTSVNLLDEYPASITTLENLLNDGGHWDIAPTQLQGYGNNATINGSGTSEVSNYGVYNLPYQTFFPTMYQNAQSYQDWKDSYKKYFIYPPGAAIKLDKQNNLNINFDTIIEAEQALGKMLTSLSGVTFSNNEYWTQPPLINANFWIATRIFVGIVLGVMAIYLIIQWRIYGFFAVLMTALNILLTLYVSSLLVLQFTPVTILALLFVTLTFISGILVIFNRFRKEMIESNLPYLTSFKIALKKNLPIVIDSIAIFIIIGLVFYWLGGVGIKFFASTIVFGFVFGSILVIGFTLLLSYILIRLKVLDHVKWLNVTKFSVFNYTKDKITTKLKTKSTDKPDYNVVDVSNIEVPKDQQLIEDPPTDKTLPLTSDQNNIKQKNEADQNEQEKK